MKQTLDVTRAAAIRKAFLIALFVLTLLTVGSSSAFSAGDFSSGDLAGTWYFYSFADDPSANDPTWSRGTVTLDASGTVTGGSRVTSDGTSLTITGGSLSINSDGVISGSLTDSSGTITVTQFKMDAGKTAATGVGIDSDNFRFLGMVIKAPSSESGDGGGGCFIATAAYGSYLHPHVQSLRVFRDKYLITNPIGRALVGLYSTYSPPLAAIIASHESLRTATRVVLTPVVYAVSYPQGAGVASVLALGLVGYTLRRKRRDV